MNEILAALGHRASPGQRMMLVSLFVVTTATILLVSHMGGRTREEGLSIHAAVWVLWFTWQGWLFPLSRPRYLRNVPIRAYRKAFFSNILPGVSVGVAQMLKPLYFGILESQGLNTSTWWISAAIALAGLGLGLLYRGFRTIGIAGAGFLYEYQNDPPILVQRGVYSHIRHPLFLGGILVSLGGSLLFVSNLSFALAVLNVAALPVYGRLEDMRLIQIFGDQYFKYRTSVGAFIPKLPSPWMVRSPRIRNLE